MINLEMVLKNHPAPHKGVIIEQHIAPEGWTQICMYASNLADLPDSKRQDTIVWAFDVCNRLTNAGEPCQFVILDE